MTKFHLHLKLPTNIFPRFGGCHLSPFPEAAAIRSGWAAAGGRRPAARSGAFCHAARGPRSHPAAVNAATPSTQRPPGMIDRDIRIVPLPRLGFPRVCDRKGASYDLGERGVNRLRLRRDAESVKTNCMRTGHENGVNPIPRSN